jgi:hypothetical protein
MSFPIRRALDGDDLVSELQRRLTQSEWLKICDLFGEGGADEGTGAPERPRDRVDNWTEKHISTISLTMTTRQRLLAGAMTRAITSTRWF